MTQTDRIEAILTKAQRRIGIYKEDPRQREQAIIDLAQAQLQYIRVLEDKVLMSFNIAMDIEPYRQAVLECIGRM